MTPKKSEPLVVRPSQFAAALVAATARVVPAADGWSEIQLAHWPTVRVRTEDVDGRRVIVALHIERDDGGPLGSEDLRHVSLAAIEAWLNRDEMATHRTRVDQRKAVQPPRDRPYPDEFYADVAQVYRELVADRRLAPAPTIAEMACVPITTVHRWVREARSRGHLPPARKGMAG